MEPASVRAAGDSGWLIELPERVDADVNRRAIQIARAVEQAGLPVSDTVVGYRSVMVYVDPLADGASGVERKMGGSSTRSAAANARANSDWKTLRHDVAERGSKIAQMRRSGYADRTPARVSAMAVG